ncbi:TonB-dependent receptor [Acetobacter sp.]|jgi:iron complex outermembrane receptor protein|uniref:TonB-dependent receptor n=1 Tax=Acetobacter sp. TaxID=440 RepID=UPI0025C4668B|nr:TonB-dependent receptor [Acetobacter sp.]MCH4090493.1 TonB-dependent receptor [Acetobacter sp.]MCI1299187.1 TonB-dependent receptor [Acetobacter sp.]MCI1315734.1 TonB-dependent receptor [Acetobacter sp.]
MTVKAAPRLLLLLLASCSLVPMSLAAEAQVSTPAANDRPAEAKKGVQADKTENIVIRAARRNRMEVTSGGQLGALGTKKGLDVPFNIRSYNSSLILNQQSQTLGQVLENDPSVRTTMGYGNFSEMFVIRGFPVNGDDISVDGLYGVVPRQLVSPQLYDQVQVLNGASAFLNGAAPSGSSIGGNINLMFKKAENTDLNRVTGDYTSNGQGGGAVDFSRRFGQDKAFGFRLNAAGMDGQTSIDHERRHDAVVGGTFDWHDDKTRIDLNMAYQNQNVQQGRGGVLLGSGVTSVPRPVAPSHNFAQRWAYADLNYLFGTLNIEHDFGKHVTVYGAFGALGSDEQGNYSSFTVTNAATGAGTVGSMYVPYQQNNESTRAGVRAHVDTGPIHHEINAGGSALWEETRTAYSMYSNSAAPLNSNLYNTPQFASPRQNLVGGNLKDPTRSNWTKLYSLYLSDTLTFWHDRIALTAGFRYQNILDNSYKYSTNGSLSAGYDKGAFTPVVGLVIHPTRQTAIYFNRIEGLAKGPQATGANVVNLGQIFAPYQSVQYELGAKYDIGRFSAGLAFYQISQPNSYTEAYGNTGSLIFRQDGLQRNRGMELTVNGEIIRGLRFNGGLTLIDADLRRTQNGTNNGHTAIGIPNYTINGNLEYDLPFLKGATVIGRVVNTGKQMVNVENTAHLPVWTRFDLAARYTFAAYGKPLTLRFGVDNLANTRFWSSAFNGYLLEGLPRTFKFSFTTDL